MTTLLILPLGQRKPLIPEAYSLKEMENKEQVQIAELLNERFTGNICKKPKSVHL